MHTNADKPTPAEQGVDGAQAACTNEGAPFAIPTSSAANDDDGAAAPPKDVVADSPAPAAHPRAD